MPAGRLLLSGQGRRPGAGLHRESSESGRSSSEGLSNSALCFVSAVGLNINGGFFSPFSHCITDFSDFSFPKYNFTNFLCSPSLLSYGPTALNEMLSTACSLRGLALVHKSSGELRVYREAMRMFEAGIRCLLSLTAVSGAGGFGRWSRGRIFGAEAFQAMLSL